MAFYFARIWLTDSAAKLVLIAAVSVAKISAANIMKRLFLLVLVLLSISSSVFAECYLDETRWKWLFSTDECGVYYDKNTARIKSPSVFEVWACSYFPGGTSCTISACKEAGRDKTEHYHFVRAEYNSDRYTYIDKNYLINDSNGKIIFSYDVVGGGQNNHSKGGEKRPILGKLRNQQLSSLNLFS